MPCDARSVRSHPSSPPLNVNNELDPVLISSARFVRRARKPVTECTPISQALAIIQLKRKAKDTIRRASSTSPPSLRPTASDYSSSDSPDSSDSDADPARPPRWRYDPAVDGPIITACEDSDDDDDEGDEEEEEERVATTVETDHGDSDTILWTDYGGPVVGACSDSDEEKEDDDDVIQNPAVIVEAKRQHPAVIGTPTRSSSISCYPYDSDGSDSDDVSVVASRYSDAFLLHLMDVKRRLERAEREEEDDDEDEEGPPRKKKKTKKKCKARCSF